jgi:hypothetical protein
MNGRKRGIAGLFLGIGSAMVALAVAGTRPAGQRTLYIISGVLFIVAGIIRLRRSDSGGRVP